MVRCIVFDKKWKESLKKFLYSNYPNREKKYLDWCVDQSITSEWQNNGGTFLIIDESEQIVACTTALWTKLRTHSLVLNMYWEANTIVNNSHRGKGLGRMIYEQMKQCCNRCTTGFTDTAYAIQSRIITHFKDISSVFVYITLNSYIISNLFSRLAKTYIKQREWEYPETICLRSIVFKRVDDIKTFNFTNDGFWQNDEVEIIRDYVFFKNRFVDIYRKYIIYQGLVEDETVCYFVVRPATYKKFDLLSLVDFRYKNLVYEKKIVEAINTIAKKNKIGMCITLTSLRKKVLSNFATIRMPKILHGGTTMSEIKENDFILITSADSDLDFVYYG